jgi:hypothetical protein
MPLSIVRKFTAEDREHLDASAWRFADRHGITLDLEDLKDLGPAEAPDQHLWFYDTGTQPRIKKLKRLWQACRCRALGVKVDASIAVGFGYVGYLVS